MEHHRLRKYRGPETWAKVRKAYLAGEPAPAVALRLDVGLANLRKKARAEGWTRKAHAAATDLKAVRGAPDDPEPASPAERSQGAAAEEGPDWNDPLDIAGAALTRAMAALKAGRPAEAQAHIKAGLEVGRFAEVVRLMQGGAPRGHWHSLNSEGPSE